LHGEFDLACDERFQDELRLHTDEPVSRLVLDLRKLTFMDSTGLKMLLALDATARSEDFELLILCDGEGAVRTVLRATGLDGVLPVADPFGLVPATDSPV
jgi:anti-sigma B factor antagonist